MEMKPKYGIFRAVFRYLRFWNWQVALGIQEAADATWTRSPQAMGQAFDIAHDQQVEAYREMQTAVAELDTILEAKRIELEKLNKREEEVLKRRTGAMNLFKQAERDGKNEDAKKHQTSWAAFNTEIQQIDARQAELEADIAGRKTQVDQYYARLTAWQREIEKLPAAKQTAIADAIAATQQISLDQRLNGLRTSFERGPIDAVTKHVESLKAQARVSSRVSGTDSALQDQQYEAAGVGVTNDDAFAQASAAFDVERKARTGDSAVSERAAEATGNGGGSGAEGRKGF